MSIVLSFILHRYLLGPAENLLKHWWGLTITAHGVDLPIRPWGGWRFHSGFSWAHVFTDPLLEALILI